MEKIIINTTFIKLDSFLKFANAVSSGAEAKIFILDGEVLVNNEVELRRGKKLYDGDIVKFGDKEYIVSH